MAVTYFGHCQSDGSPSPTADDGNNDNAIVLWMDATAPGVGTLDITEFGCFLYKLGGGDTICRMAIYDSAGTTLIQQSAQIPITNAAPDAWSSDLTLYPAILTGGTLYKIAISCNANGIQTDSFEFFLPDTAFKLGEDYTSGFPASLPTPDGEDGGIYTIRVGTQPSEAEDVIYSQNAGVVSRRSRLMIPSGSFKSGADYVLLQRKQPPGRFPAKSYHNLQDPSRPYCGDCYSNLR